jgi:hypothetical protein
VRKCAVAAPSNSTQEHARGVFPWIVQPSARSFCRLPYWLAGIASGCTLPQSAPLNVAVDCMVMFMVFPPIEAVICTVVLVVPASTNVICTVPLIGIWPVQARFAVIPVAVSETPVIWQFPRCGLLYGPPNLSIIACVTQTCMVRGGIEGICCPFDIDMLVAEVTSHKPGFLL